MKSVFEVIVQDVLPTARALVAKRLIETYGLSQKQAAERLGLSQPAISQYKRELRGTRIHIFNNNQKILDKIDSLAKRAAGGEMNQVQISLEICGLYKFLKPEDFTEEIEEYLED